MAGNADTVGRLLATGALLNGERELLRPSPSEAQTKSKPAATPQTSSPPLANNSKAVASVLLTLLNEQIDSAALADRQPRATANERAQETTSDRWTGRYLDAGFTSSPADRQPEATFQAGATTINPSLTPASAELLAQMQRLGIKSIDIPELDRSASAARRTLIGALLGETPDRLLMLKVGLAAAAVVLIAAVGLFG